MTRKLPLLTVIGTLLIALLPIDGNAQASTPRVTTVAARSPDRVIPPDVLRWIAAGVLLLVLSLLLRVLAYRIAPPPHDDLPP